MVTIKSQYDLRFVEIKSELSAVSIYLDALKKYLPFIKEQEKIQTQAWIDRKSDELEEEDVDIARYEIYECS